ncbi:Trm112 family protein [Parvularcula sp. LCG005]|uniref:Trm112 family protein n=1 Tax=Parvularcula sp. LCG005 TaxID=3078805 RepID=UPI00397AEC2B
MEHHVDPALLTLLVCPVTRAPLRYDAEAQELISDKAHLAYPIRSGIPIMLEAEARRTDDDAARALAGLPKND